MSDIEKINVTESLIRTGDALQGTIDDRIASLLPAVIGEDGSVDWAEVRHLPVTWEIGSLVVAKAIPELIYDEARITRRLEDSGRLNDALDHRAYVQALQAGSAFVLNTINDELFNTAEFRDGMLTKKVVGEDGSVEQERVQNAAQIMDFADALIMEMQAVTFDIKLNPETENYELNSEQLSLFIDKLAMPAAKLARDGISAETAFALIKVETVTGVEMEEILDAAKLLSVNIDDQSELNKLAYALTMVTSFSELQQFIDPSTKLFTLLNTEDSELDEIQLQADGSILPRRVISDDIDSDELELREDQEVHKYMDAPEDEDLDRVLQALEGDEFSEFDDDESDDEDDLPETVVSFEELND